MNLTPQNAAQVLAGIFTNLKSTFNTAFAAAESTADRVAMEVPSHA